MCGIAGIVQWVEAQGGEPLRSAPSPIDATILQNIDDLLRHRGPDGAGIWTSHPQFSASPCPRVAESVTDGSPQVVLMHRRLAIVDLSDGRQPLANENQTVQVVFNGEIYNHRALRQELVARGHVFRTDHSDTEVLVHGWEEWAAALPEKLIGMFSFAIWDEPRRTLFLARDRLGQKPLFYSDQPRQVAFASTLPALLAFPGVPAESSLRLIAAYLAHGYLPPPYTIYTTVRQVEPGQWLLWRAGHLQEERYWPSALDRQRPVSPCRRVAVSFLPSSDSHLPASISADPAGQLRQLLEQAVATQLEADVPIACFLSGGIDSGIIAALMQRAVRAQGGEAIKTVSIAFEEGGFNEVGYARQIASAVGSEHHEFPLTAGHGVMDTLQWLMHDALGSPFADSSILPTYYVANAARTVAPCALSGDGADELFGGYDRYRAMRLLSRWRIPLMAATNVACGLSRRERLQRLKAAANQRLWFDQYADLTALFNAAQQREYFTNLPAAGSLRWPDSAGESESAFRQAMRLDRRHYLPGDVLWKVDSASMACGLEVRSPFLDHRVAEWADTLPDYSLLNARRGKLLLRRAFRELLPPAIFQRRKHGFAVPIGAWLKGSLQAPWRDFVCRPGSLTGQITHPGAAEKLFHEHQTGRRDHTHRLFALLMLELWYRRFQPRIAAS